MRWYRVIVGIMISYAFIFSVEPVLGQSLCSAKAEMTFKNGSCGDIKDGAECISHSYNTKGCKCQCFGNCTGSFVPTSFSNGFSPQYCKWNKLTNVCTDDLGIGTPVENLLEVLRQHELDEQELLKCDSECASQALVYCKNSQLNPVPMPYPAPAPAPVNPYSPGNFNPGDLGNTFERCVPYAAGAVIGYCCYKAGQVAAGFFVAGPGGAVGAAFCP